MKRIISFICMIAVLCTMFLPVVSNTEAKAAEAEWHTYWTTTKGSPRLTESGSMILPTGSEIRYTSALPKKYTVEFSANVRKYSVSVGLQGRYGVRPGGYIRDGYIGSMAGGLRINVENNITGWHDYKYLIDLENKIQKVYYDGIYVGEFVLEEANAGGNWWTFWAESNGELEVDDVVFTEITGAVAEETEEKEEMTVPAEGYSEPFFYDLYDLNGVRLWDDGGFVTHNAEEGIVSIDHYAGRLQRSGIEIPLKPPANFDMEYRLRMSPVDSQWEKSSLSVEVSVDTRHTWLYLNPEMLAMRHNAEYREDPHYDGPFIGVPVGFPSDGEWHIIKAEIRDRMITWYDNGKEIVSYEYYYRGGTSVYHTWIGIYSSGSANGLDADIDWVKYTPYVDDELKITSPMTNSEVLAGSDIFITGETALDTDKIDYYINTVYVGSGYKKNGFSYTLKNVKAGRYHITAKVGEVETSETIVNVLNQYDGRLTLSKNKIKVGESLKAKAEVNSLGNSYKGVKADFYVNGQLYFTDKSAPFETELKDLRIGTNSVVTKIYDSANVCVQTNTENVDVSYVKGAKFEIGREYELNYEYKSGTGKIHLNDGYFDLTITNNKDGITYVTNEGSKTYKNIGYGKYKVVVTAGHAEIYWKDQFLQSILLPYKPAKAEFTNSGVTNLTLAGSGVKTEIAGINWKSDMKTWSSGPLPVKEQYYYSLEFDKKDTSTEEVYISDGHYNATLYFREDGIYALRQLKVNVPPTELKLADEVKPGYYRLTVGHGIAHFYCNNELVGNFRFIDYYAAQAEIKRTMSNPSSSNIFVLKNSNDVYYHSDDFENKAELPSEDYWSARPTNYRLSGSEKITTKLNEENGNHFTTLEGSGVYVLNATDKYPQLKWRGRIDEASGRVFAVIRMALSDAQEKIGYDFDKKSWFHETIKYNGPTTDKYTELAPNALKAGEWYDFELKTEDFDVTLLVNGKEVFKVRLENNLDGMWFGRFGVGVQGSKYSFDDFCYKGENRVTPGAVNFANLQVAGKDINSWNGDYAVERNVAGNVEVADFFRIDDDTVYARSGLGINQGMMITDNGKTWKEHMGANPFDTLEATGNYAQLPNGTWVYLPHENVLGNPQYCRISKDGGKTWSEKYLVHSGEYGHLGTGHRLREAGGKLFVTYESAAESTTRFSIFYTEDGMNWHLAEPGFIDFEKVGGVVVQESFVIEAPDGEIRLYARSNVGFIVYLRSYDGGKTFDTNWNYTSLPQCECCFSIRRDENDPYTYYAAIQYGTEPAQQSRGGSPRTQYAFFVSRDGMETWEFVSDLVSTGSVPSMNMSDLMMDVYGDVMYYAANSILGPGLKYVGSQDLNKIKSLKRLPQYHFLYDLGYNVARDLADKHCVVSKDKGTAWYYGTYSAASVKDGRADLSTIENIFGVTASKSGNKVTLKLGDGKVTFTEGSAEYDNNGAKGTAEREILKNGYLDLKTVTEIYGKVFREAENSYVILDNGEAIHPFQTSIDNMV